MYDFFICIYENMLLLYIFIHIYDFHLEIWSYATFYAHLCVFISKYENMLLFIQVFYTGLWFLFKNKNMLLFSHFCFLCRNNIYLETRKCATFCPYLLFLYRIRKIYFFLFTFLELIKYASFNTHVGFFIKK